MLKRLLLIACTIVIIAAVWPMLSRQAETQSSQGPSGDDSEREEAHQPASSSSQYKPSIGTASGTVPYRANYACVTEDQWHLHPLVVNEVSRLAPYGIFNTPDMEPYRGLSEQQLSSFVSQHDSAAMAVLGSIYLNRALGRSDTEAVDRFYPRESDVHLRNIPANQEELFQQAAYWFYEAALHGRLEALGEVGVAHFFALKSPVELGLISQTDFLKLPVDTRRRLIYEVYSALAYRISPNVKSHLFNVRGENAERSMTRYPEIIDALYAEFEKERASRGLPDIQVPASQLPPEFELTSLLCES